MAFAPRLDLRQTQTLVMTPQLRQAIQLLQYTNIEASQFIEDELLKNPLLERLDGPETVSAIEAPDLPPPPPVPETVDTASFATSAMLPAGPDAPLDFDLGESYDAGTAADGFAGFHEDAEDWNAIDGLSGGAPNLREHLEQQARLAFTAGADRLIAGALIGLLDEAGRIAEPAEAIAAALGVEAARIEQVRAQMMRFEPTGIFARDLCECLTVQLEERNRLDPAMQALLAHLDLLARRDLRGLMQICGVDAQDMMEMIAEIRRLDPKPGAHAGEPLRPLIPDVLMRPMPVTGEGTPDWLLEINPETMPRLLIRRGFHARIAASASRETKSFLSEQMQGATWLVKALESRAQTILRVSAEIVRRQDGFFRHGISHLRPLTLRDIAAEVELHESTVSRVTSNKSIATPRGIFELKFFFTTALAGANGETHSAETVRRRVAALIFGEPPQLVLSDDAIAARLQKEGIDIARRTVAKYREALRIPGSAQRKREKSVAY